METLKTRWLEIVEDIVIGAALLLLAFGVAGCVPGGMFMADPATMSPEQMKEFKAMGYDAVRCATVTGGPPVGGTVTSVTIPKDRAATVKFIGCQVQSIEIGALPPVPIVPLK